MPLYEIKYFPEKGNRDSPNDVYKSINLASERATIDLKLGQLASTLNINWAEVVNLKPIDKKHYKHLLQITCGNYRVYIELDNDKGWIVIFHICRKMSQKAQESDIATARSNRDRYFDRKGA